MKYLSVGLLLTVLLCSSSYGCLKKDNDQQIEQSIVEEDPNEVEPKDEVEPVGEVEPIGEVEPEGEVEPAGEVEPVGEVEPKGEIGND